MQWAPYSPFHSVPERRLRARSNGSAICGDITERPNVFDRCFWVGLRDAFAGTTTQIEHGNFESISPFERTNHPMKEILLRFMHHDWFHEISDNALARDRSAGARCPSRDRRIHAWLALIQLNVYKSKRATHFVQAMTEKKIPKRGKLKVVRAASPRRWRAGCAVSDSRPRKS